MFSSQAKNNNQKENRTWFQMLLYKPFLIPIENTSIPLTKILRYDNLKIDMLASETLPRNVTLREENSSLFQSGFRFSKNILFHLNCDFLQTISIQIPTNIVDLQKIPYTTEFFVVNELNEKLFSYYIICTL